jgi:hypothetical protein
MDLNVAARQRMGDCIYKMDWFIVHSSVDSAELCSTEAAQPRLKPQKRPGPAPYCSQTPGSLMRCWYECVQSLAAHFQSMIGNAGGGVCRQPWQWQTLYYV